MDDSYSFEDSPTWDAACDFIAEKHIKSQLAFERRVQTTTPFQLGRSLAALRAPRNADGSFASVSGRVRTEEQLEEAREIQRRNRARRAARVATLASDNTSLRKEVSELRAANDNLRSLLTIHSRIIKRCRSCGFALSNCTTYGQPGTALQPPPLSKHGGLLQKVVQPKDLIPLSIEIPKEAPSFERPRIVFGP